MSKISLKSFKGLIPSKAARLLPDSSSQVAINCNFASGSATPFRSSVPAHVPQSSNQINTIYLYTDKNNVKQWLSWDGIVDVVRGPVANDLTSRIYYTGDGYPKATDSDRLLQPTPYYLLGVPEPATKPTVTVNNPGTLPISRVYAVTHVTAWGEESAPSLVSDIVEAGSLSQVTLSNIPQSANNTDHNPVTKIYIYRSVSGTNSTSFQFLAEIAHGITSYVDTKEDTELAEGIKTLDGNEPPTDMFGLMTMENGVMVGFTEFEVCFSEPYQPHSWPNKYKLATTNKIIGGGVFGNRIVVCTNKEPLTITGTDPELMSMSSITDILPCVSKKGIVSMSGGVVFPTPDGLYYVGSGGVINLTKDLYTEEEWKTLNPDEFSATQWDGKYIAFTSEKGYLFDIKNPEEHTYLSYTGTAAHSDTDNKYLYFNQYSGSSNEVHRFHASSYYDLLTWRSKEFFYSHATAFSAGQIFTKGNGVTSADIVAAQLLYDTAAADNAVIFATGSLGGTISSSVINNYSINGSDMTDLPTVPNLNIVNVKFYTDGQLVRDVDVSDKEIFRLPINGFKGHEFEIELITPLTIDEANFATSVKELQF